MFVQQVYVRKVNNIVDKNLLYGYDYTFQNKKFVFGKVWIRKKKFLYLICYNNVFLLPLIFMNLKLWTKKKHNDSDIQSRNSSCVYRWYF
jgi:hypothetical protein